MKKKKLGLWLGIVLGALIIITILAAPARNQLQGGSTYSHAPDGYGAWYDYMQQRGTPLQRLQKPPKDWFESRGQEKTTLIRIYNQPSWHGFSEAEDNWLRKGNRMVILGIPSAVTPAPFTSYLHSNVGAIRIDTTRRGFTSTPILGDSFGAVIWRQKTNLGEIIYVTTPHLAANAYQDNIGNYEFLAQLVTAPNYPLWIDEYLHGYKDKDTIRQEVGSNLWSYWLKTPLLLLFSQGIVILLFVLWSSNHRFGKALTLTTPTVNNSLAYIQALARVLERANTRDFVVTTITQAETQQLQKQLGIETTELAIIIDHLIQQYGGNNQELLNLIKNPKKSQKIKNIDLLEWLHIWYKMKNKLLKK